MAELKISIIPADPDLVPSQEAVKKLKALIKRMLPYLASDDLKITQFPQPRFFSSADGCDSFVCPRCAKKTTDSELISETGDERAWSTLIQLALDAVDAMSHRVDMPCCKQSILLPEIIFQRPGGVTAAIGKFRLRIADVDDVMLEEGTKTRIEKALGCSVVRLVEVYS